MGARSGSSEHLDSFHVELDRFDRAWSRQPDLPPTAQADARELISFLAQMAALPAPEVLSFRLVPVMVRAMSVDAQKRGGDLERLTSLVVSLRRDLG